MESIIDNDRADRCYMCHKQGRTELHHIYFGKNRKISDKHGFVVHLCRRCHREEIGVHGREGYLMDIHLKKACQLKYEEEHTRQEFMALIGCNYLDDEED